MSLMFDISYMIVVLQVCVFQRYIYHVPNVWHIIYDYCSTCMCLPLIHTVNFWYVIYDHCSLSLYLLEVHTMTVMFDMPSMIIVLYVAELSRVKHCHTLSAKPDYNQLKNLWFSWYSKDNQSQPMIFWYSQRCVVHTFLIGWINICNNSFNLWHNLWNNTLKWGEQIRGTMLNK